MVNLVVPQVAQGGGIALSSGEEVLVDAQNLRAAGWLPLGELALEAAAEIALDGGGADAFSAPQAAAVDAVQVLLVMAFWNASLLLHRHCSGLIPSSCSSA